MPEITKPEETRRDWELIQKNSFDYTERLKIANGWLYRTVVDNRAISMVFVPGE